MTDIVNTVVQLINGVGFPIAACVFMAIFIMKYTKQVSISRKADGEQTKMLYAQLKEAVDNNTKMVEKLIDKLGVE